MQSEVKKIEQLLGEDYLKKFRIFHEITLFPPCWEALKERRCPLCFNKLKIPKTNKIAFCRSAKHKKSFVISIEKLEEFERLEKFSGTTEQIKNLWLDLVFQKTKVEKSLIPVKDIVFYINRTIQEKNWGVEDFKEVFNYFFSKIKKEQYLFSYQLCFSDKFLANYKLYKKDKKYTFAGIAREMKL